MRHSYIQRSEKLWFMKEIFWFLFETLIRQGAKINHVRSSTTRIIIGTWLLITVVLISGYCGVLFSYMTHTVYETVPTTIQELATSVRKGEYSCGIMADTTVDKYLLDTKEESVKTIADYIRKNPDKCYSDIDSAMQHVLDTKYAYFAPKSILESLARIRGEDRFAFSKDSLVNFMVAYPMKKRFELRNELNKIIGWIRDTGIYKKLEKDVMPQSTKQISKDTFHPFSIEDILRNNCGHQVKGFIGPKMLKISFNVKDVIFFEKLFCLFILLNVYSLKFGISCESEVHRNLVKVRITALPFSPYVEVRKRNNDIIFHGPNFNLWNIVIQNFKNVKYEVVQPIEKVFGIDLGNGSWNGLIGRVQKKDVDLSINSVCVTYKRLQAIDFTIPIQTERTVFIVTAPQRVSDITAISRPYSLKVWICMLVSLFMTGICIFFISVTRKLCFRESRNSWTRKRIFWFLESPYNILSDYIRKHPEKNFPTFEEGIHYTLQHKYAYVTTESFLASIDRTKLRRVIDAGIYEKLIQNFEESRINSAETFHPLAIDDIVGAFALLITGFTISTVFLFAELLFKLLQIIYEKRHFKN
ncbi:uncharacterized protein LOC111642271 [Centruroides sculpturatus]|uniref:uncharacterized protein LOC111642271 n=1 Tax=Centruroides sculpturatus TaxID=218467 RepID=UPI000C6EC08B|nr:uncharacterized protein LOC111642271 [Centruroides sculpturatus]